MKIKIMLGDSEKEIIISPNKKHRNEFMDRAEEMQKVSKDEDCDGIKVSRDFMDFQDNLAVECSSLTQEEYDELDLEEQTKVTKAVMSIIFPMASGDPALFFQR